MKKENGPKAVFNLLFKVLSVSFCWRKIHEQTEAYGIGKRVSVHPRSGRNQVRKINPER
jgi:hypothetical protein